MNTKLAAKFPFMKDAAEMAAENEADIEKLLDTQVNLQLYVKVRKDWRNDVRQLKNFGLWTDE